MTAPEADPTALAREAHRIAGLDGEPRLRFLARGEYSLNYVTFDTPEPLVVRCITGSQIGLPLGEQVCYESRALRLLARSGRTPRWIAAQPQPSEMSLPFLVESFLPGRPLAYETDLEEAARCIAAIHQVPVPTGHGLQVHADPGPSIVTESRAWAADYFTWRDAPRASLHALARAFESVETQLDEATDLFAEPDLALVNYDLNTHNFIVRPEDGFVSLVDWEKARIAPATQDLAHFLLPTTTLWRADTATLLTPAQEQRFLDAYLTARPDLDRHRHAAQLAAMKRLIALRAVSWCSWAVASAATGTRAIVNTETLEHSRAYLEPAFLDTLFAHPP